MFSKFSQTPKKQINLFLRNLGIIQVSKKESSKDTEILSYYNNINPSNYFLKAFGKTHISTTETGNYCIGCTFQALKTDAKDGKKHTITASQAYSPSFTRLHLPFVLLGLEKTTNYI